MFRLGINPTKQLSTRLLVPKSADGVDTQGIFSRPDQSDTGRAGIFSRYTVSARRVYSHNQTYRTRDARVCSHDIWFRHAQYILTTRPIGHGTRGYVLTIYGFGTHGIFSQPDQSGTGRV
eukprot:1490341-Pyramimonas_sp.AAC.1